MLVMHIYLHKNYFLLCVIKYKITLTPSNSPVQSSKMLREESNPGQ